MRHVSKTHRVALDWLFDRINLEPIQIKYIDTKNQLADRLTKGIFTRDEWNHLLCLFNIMNFSMFSCNFLSDPNGKQSAMSKRRLDATSREGSPVAKTKPTVPAKARPINLVLHSPWNARANPSQDLGNSVNPGKDDKGHLTRTRKLEQTTQNPEVERSQVVRQENAQKFRFLGTVQSGGSFALCRHKETCACSNSKNGNSKYEVHEPSVHDKYLPLSAKEVGNYRSILNGLNGSIEDTCIDMENVYGFIDECSHSSWTELFGEIGDLQEHELRRNSELIQYHTEIDIGAF